VRRYFVVGPILILALLVVVACGDDDTSPSASTSASTASSSPAAATATPTPGATRSNAEAALAGVNDILNRANDARCPTPLTAPCNILYLDPAGTGTEAEHGLATFVVKENGVPDVHLTVGETADGQWFQYLWGNPLYADVPIYNPTTLPAIVTICAFGGKATVYSASNPSSSEAGTLDEGATPTSDRFVLTDPGTIGNAAVNIQGHGWYHLEEPAGWVYSKFVSAGPGCALHDQLEQR